MRPLAALAGASAGCGAWLRMPLADLMALHAAVHGFATRRRLRREMVRGLEKEAVRHTWPTLAIEQAREESEPPLPLPRAATTTTHHLFSGSLCLRA